MIIKDILNTDYAYYGRQSMILPRVASFNGTNDYIDTGIDLTDAQQVDITMICYRGSAGIYTVAMQYDATSRRVGLYWNTSNDIYVMACNGSPGSNAYVNNVTDTGWFTLRMVYDGTQATNATKLKLYVNGILQTLIFNVDIPASLGLMNLRDFNIGWQNLEYMDGLVSYVSVSKNGGTPYEYYPIGMGDYEYDVSGQNQHGTWSGTGGRYTYDELTSTRLIKEGYSLWQKDANPNIHVPLNNDGGALSLTPGVNIGAGYSKSEDIQGNATYYNFADALFDFDPDGTINSKLDVFDKSNATIHIATGSMDFYNASYPYGWLGSELRSYSKYNSYFNVLYQDRLFTKVEDGLLKDIFNLHTKLTGNDLTKAKLYCGII